MTLALLLIVVLPLSVAIGAIVVNSDRIMALVMAVPDFHFPAAPAGALGRTPKARTAADAEFLALGDGARLWLTEAAAAGTTRMRIKMAAAVATGKLVGGADVASHVGRMFAMPKQLIETAAVAIRSATQSGADKK